MVNKLKINLDKKYITKPLEPDTLLKVIASEHPSVLHRLYMIANEVGELQYFMEIDHPTLACTAKIKTNFAYTGQAKEQASVVNFMRPYIKQKPSYIVSCKVYEKVGMREVFDFKQEGTRVDNVINWIYKLEQKVLELCQDKVNMY